MQAYSLPLDGEHYKVKALTEALLGTVGNPLRLVTKNCGPWKWGAGG